jgi:glycosyltransferase involved in cell wall biosynthesis
VAAKLKQILQLPLLVWQLSKAMRRADAIHVRCPGNLGLLGVLLAPLFSRFLVAKYAGQWKAFRGEAATFKFQRALLRSSWWRGPVTVYGDWPGEPDHVVPFFTSGLTAAQIERARKTASRRGKTDVLRVLHVGRLSPDKNVHALIEAIARTLDRPGKAVECMIIGDGPERAALESLSARLGLRSRVTFTGGVPIESVLDHYEHADVLVLASNSEGWPKAITEAMAFGLLCVGSDRGLIPQILGDGRGILVPPGNSEAVFDALQWVRERPLEALEVSRRAAEWSQRYSLEGLRDALRALLEARWQVSLRGYAGSSGRGQG